MRILVLILSLGTIFFYGKALGGLGGYLVGKGAPELIVLGLTAGTLSALAALLLWKKYLHISEKNNGNNAANSPQKEEGCSLAKARNSRARRRSSS